MSLNLYNDAEHNSGATLSNRRDSMALKFKGRLGIQQRLLPHYRVGFFESLAGQCSGGLSVFAGQAGLNEALNEAGDLRVAKYFQGNNLHILTANSPYYLLWQRGLLRWLEEWNPDVIVVEANPRYLSTRLAIRWMNRRNRPVIGWGLGMRQPDGAAEKRKGLARMQNWWSIGFMNSFSGFIAYSKKGADEYRALGTFSGRVFIAPNAVMSKPAGRLPERHGFINGHATVLFVGRLQARKRIENLINACADLPESIQPNVWIVGDGPIRPELEYLANSIYPRTEFFGSLHGDQVKPYFESADLFVLPGTGGLAIQEAMSYGLPVIVAEGDGTQNELVGPNNGWLVPSNDVRSLKTTLQEALSDPDRLRSMGRESYHLVSDEINLEKMVEKFINAVHSICKIEELTNHRSRQ